VTVVETKGGLWLARPVRALAPEVTKDMTMNGKEAEIPSTVPPKRPASCYGLLPGSV